MKRRIIAALTALVMVVTMIPASAFAQSYTVDDVNGLIKLLMPANKISYDQRADFETAWNAYSSLTDADKNKVTDSQKLLDAKTAFDAFDNAVKTVNDEMTTVVKEVNVMSADLSDGTKSINKAMVAFDVIDSDITKGTVTLVMPAAGSDDLKKVLVEKVGEKNYTTLSALNADTTDATAAFKYVNAMADAVDADDIAAINASNYNTSTNTAVNNYNKAKTYVDKFENNKAALYIAKGYDKYIATEEAIAKYTDLRNNLSTISTNLAKLDKVDGEKEMSSLVSEIDKVYADDASKVIDKKTFEETMALAEKVFAEYGDKLDPGFSDCDYAGVLAQYELTLKAKAKYDTKDAVEKAIRELPKVADIQKADYATLIKYQEQYNAIDADVVGITDLASTYATVGDEINKRMATFDDAYIAADYANRLADAIAKIPADVTRNDIDAVNAAVQVVLDYVKYGKVEDISAVSSSNQFDNASVEKLYAKSVTKLTNNDLNSTVLIAELNKIDKNAWGKLVQNQNAIVDQIAADKEKVDAVYDELKDSALDATKIKNETTAKAAQDQLKKYNEEYAKLSGFAKSDYDALHGAEATKVVTEVSAKIAEYIANAEDVLAANKAADAIKALVKLQESNISVGSADYNSAVAYINTVEAIFKERPATVELVKKMDKVESTATSAKGNNLYEQYVDRKAFVDSLTEASNAPTAVINAIDNLPVVAKDADKATVDSAIASHKSVVAMYNALTAKEKALVSNYTKFKTVEDAIVVAVKNVMNTEAAKIGTVVSGSKLTATQKDAINAVTAMNKTYLEVTGVEGNKLFTAENDGKYINFGDEYAEFKKGVDQLALETETAAEEEFNLIVPALKLANTYYSTTTRAFTVDKKSALDIIAAADAVAGLSDAAKEYGKTDLENTYHYSALLVAYKDAKALVLDYATVEVADVEFDGTPATPEVVVKDANGIVVDASQYTVAYSNNTLPGTATVIVTAKADGKYLGSVTKEFKVIAKELAKVENVKFDTDYGIVRVFFDRTADIDGVDVRYQVQYKKTTSDTWTTKYPTVGYEYLTLKSLTKNGKYDVRVRAYTDDYGTERVYGEYSDVQTVYANRNGAKSGIMYKAVINSLTTKNGSVTVKVNPVKYSTEPTTVTWKYSYKKYGSQYTTWSTWKTTKNTSYTFNNLTKGVRYVFRVQYTYTSAVDGKTAVNSNYSVYKNIVVK